MCTSWRGDHEKWHLKNFTFMLRSHTPCFGRHQLLINFSVDTNFFANFEERFSEWFTQKKYGVSIERIIFEKMIHIHCFPRKQQMSRSHQIFYVNYLKIKILVYLVSLQNLHCPLDFQNNYSCYVKIVLKYRLKASFKEKIENIK